MWIYSTCVRVFSHEFTRKFFSLFSSKKFTRDVNSLLFTYNMQKIIVLNACICILHHVNLLILIFHNVNSLKTTYIYKKKNKYIYFFVEKVITCEVVSQVPVPRRSTGTYLRHCIFETRHKFKFYIQSYINFRIMSMSD